MCKEWDDYRENKKDYSGLKIETLKIEEPQEEEEEETEINEVSSGTGTGNKKSKIRDRFGQVNFLGLFPII
jgi:hypothetical protein